MLRPTRAKCVNVRLCVAADDNRTGLYATKNYFGPCRSSVAARASRDFADIHPRWREKDGRAGAKNVDITKSHVSRQRLVVYPTFLYILHYR